MKKLNLFILSIACSTTFSYGQWVLTGSNEIMNSGGHAIINLGVPASPTFGISSTYSLNTSGSTTATIYGALNDGTGGFNPDYQFHGVYGKVGLASMDISDHNGDGAKRGADGGYFETNFEGSFIHGEAADKETYVSGVRGVLSGSGYGLNVNGAVSAVIGLDLIKNNTYAGYFDGAVKVTNGELNVTDNATIQGDLTVNGSFVLPEGQPSFNRLTLSNGPLTISGSSENWTPNNWKVGMKSPYGHAWVTSNGIYPDNYHLGIGMTNTGWYFIRSTDAPGEDNDESGCYYPFFVTLEGKTITREIEVTLSNWCDYVFDHDYRLRPIDELEAFISENHHLPEVPSEKEVLTNGLNLGEMNAILLKKIEELTLYVIDMKKENDALKARMDKVENHN